MSGLVVLSARHRHAMPCAYENKVDYCVYTQPKKYSYAPLFVFFNYLDSYSTYMFGIFLKTIQFPVQ